MGKTFVGFGFGAIQAGLFLYEANRSGSFDTLVVAEVVPETVKAVRKANGSYNINIAGKSGIRQSAVENVIILNPTVDTDREHLLHHISEAHEIATALPSVDFYGKGDPYSVAGIIATGITRARSDAQRIIYAAENHNHAAEILFDAIAERSESNLSGTQCLNTVIGKMSGVVSDPGQIAEQNLAPVTGNIAKAFLVEEFNRILVSKVELPGFKRGIEVFEEKSDLLPFEHAKLYGHNATHALMGYLARLRGCEFMDQLTTHADLVKTARTAFIEESGAALCAEHAGVDPLFTPDGYQAYAEDLLERMMNPHLRDAVDRVTRDPLRKLGWDDRLVGTMRIALKHGIRPSGYASGAAAAVKVLELEYDSNAENILSKSWTESGATPEEVLEMRNLIAENTS